MSDGFGKCSTGDGRDAGIEWPLLGGTKLCSECYDNPPPQYAGLVAESNAPPDDFDIPEWDEPPLLPRWLTANERTWVTREGRAIPIRQLEDSHLHNIERMLERIEGQMGDADEEGQPTEPGPPLELFDRKFSAIKAEIHRREP